jgi:DNA-binding SARP family transcriptional activator
MIALAPGSELLPTPDCTPIGHNTDVVQVRWLAGRSLWVAVLVLDVVLFATGAALVTSHQRYDVLEVNHDGATVVNAAPLLGDALTQTKSMGEVAAEGSDLQCWFLSELGGPPNALVGCGPTYPDGFQAFSVTYRPVPGGFAGTLGTPSHGYPPVESRLLSPQSEGVVQPIDQAVVHRVGDRAKRVGGYLVGAALVIPVLLLGMAVRAGRAHRLRRSEDAQVSTLDRQWSQLGWLPTGAPIVPPSAVYVPPPRASPGPGPQRTGPSSEPPMPAVADEVPEPITPKPMKTAAPSDEPLEPPAAHWSGPAVLVLGPVMVTGWAVMPDRRILVELAAYLATHQEHPVSAGHLRTALWPVSDGDLDEVAAKTLPQAVSRLRRCLGEGHLPDAREAGGYQLASTVSSDWFRFQALVEAARRCDDHRACELLRQALGLVRGRPFAGVEDNGYGWVWEDLLVTTMEAAITAAAHRMAGLSLALGTPRLAEWAAGRGLQAVPTDEVLLEDRMTAALAVGGRPALDRAWRDARATLGAQADDGPLADAYRRLSGSAD